jgi:DNA-binding beta-propeller fold protein YncE
MQRNFWLTIGTFVCTLLLAACRAGSASAPTSTPSPPSAIAGESLYIVDGVQDQHIISFHPGSPTTLTLPAGLFTQDHARVYTALPLGGKSTISIINTRTGSTERTFSIDGSYTTAGQEYTQADLSPDGHWLALREQGQNSITTTIALVDTQAGEIAKTIQLNGNFDLDTISPHGDLIYLLERDSDQPGHYYVRRFDVTANQLLEGYIVDKLATSWDSMIGSALTRRMSQDGRVAYTLYIDAANNKAFVHNLPLNRDLPLARCINLPVGKTSDLLRYYTMALSPDGKTLYAANSKLGVIVSIDVSAAFDNIPNVNTKSTAHFTPDSSASTQSLYNGAVVSPDGNMLYFVGTHGIWAADSGDLKIKQQYATKQTFTSIAISTNGNILYGIASRGVTLVNVASGASQLADKCPAHMPRGIAWVSNG